jgi:DNA-binding NarL/FixJ family response regulator
MTESSATAPIRVLLADDEETVRAGVRLILRHAEGIEVVAEASNGAEAVELAAHTRVDVALVDIRMPVLDGLAAIEQLLRLDPHPAVVMLTTFGDEANVIRALQAGAGGFLLKDDGPQELISAVRAAAEGDEGSRPASGDGAGQAAGPTPAQLVAALSEQERQVLSMLGQGMPNLELSLRLGLGPDAVKTLVSEVLAKTGTESRVQAALLAASVGLAD